MTQRCTVCRQKKTISEDSVKTEFYPKERWPDGSIRRWQSECKDCQREIQRVRVGIKRRGKPYEARKPKMTPAEKREHKRRKYREEMADPVRRAQRRESQRMYAALRRRAAGVPQKGPYRLSEDSTEPLKKLYGSSFKDPQPFVEWYTSLNGTTPTEVELGENLARAIRRVLTGEQAKVNLATVDEVGVLVGEPHLVHVLYPDAH